MNKLVLGFVAAAVAISMSGTSLAGSGKGGDNGRGGGNAGGGNAGGGNAGGGNAGGNSASGGGSVGSNGVGGAGMGRNDWTGGWSEYFGSTEVGNGLGRRNYGLAVRINAWRGSWGEQVGGEGGQAHSDGDLHRGERVQRYLGTVLGVGSKR